MIVELNENDIATLRHILNEASKLRVDWSKFDDGFKGVDFGSALKELSNWYYKQVANNKNPSNVDIEKFVGAL